MDPHGSAAVGIHSSQHVVTMHRPAADDRASHRPDPAPPAADSDVAALRRLLTAIADAAAAWTGLPVPSAAPPVHPAQGAELPRRGSGVDLMQDASYFVATVTPRRVNPLRSKFDFPEVTPMAPDQATTALSAQTAESELRLSRWAWPGSATTTPATHVSREEADASRSRARALSGQRNRPRPRHLPLASRSTLQPA